MDILQQWMQKNGKRDVDVYAHLGVSKQTFNGWKSRKSIPKTREMSVSEMMGVSLEHLKTGKGSPDMQAKEDAAKYTVKPMPWPQSPDQINLVMVNDIADRVCAATGADMDMIKKEIFAGIIEYYKKKEEEKPDE